MQRTLSFSFVFTRVKCKQFFFVPHIYIYIYTYERVHLCYVTHNNFRASYILYITVSETTSHYCAGDGVNNVQCSDVLVFCVRTHMDIPVLCYTINFCFFLLFVTSASDAHSAALLVSVAVYILFLFLFL